MEKSIVRLRSSARQYYIGALWIRLSACMQNFKFQGLHNEVIPCPRFFVVFRKREGGGGSATGGRADILDRLIHAKLHSTHGSPNCVMKHLAN